MLTLNIKIIIFAILFLSIIPLQKVLAAEIPAIKADKGLVVVYRVKRMKGAAIPIGIHYTNGSVGTLSSGSVISKYLTPGEYNFYSKVIVEDSLNVNVEAGHIYFIEGFTKMGFVVSRPKLRLVPEKEAKKAIKKI